MESASCTLKNRTEKRLWRQVYQTWLRANSIVSTKQASKLCILRAFLGDCVLHPALQLKLQRCTRYPVLKTGQSYSFSSYESCSLERRLYWICHGTRTVLEPRLLIFNTYFISYLVWSSRPFLNV